MELPNYPYVLFGRPPLVLVVGQIRFSPQPGFADGMHLAAFGKLLRDQYPKSERFEQLNVSLSPVHGVESQAGQSLWRFSSIDGAWSVVLGEDALTLEVREYTAVAEFLDRFAHALECLSKTIDPSLQTRLGIRYIDEFRYEGATTIRDWSTLIKPEFLGFAMAADQLLGSTPIQRTRQQLEVAMPDGTLVIRHGLLSGTSVEPADSNKAPHGDFYLLDMDYYDASPRPIDRDAVIATLRGYNDVMYRFFRWVMQEELYRSLEPQDEA